MFVPPRARRLPSRLRRSLRACTVDGALHASMLGFAETYFAAFGLHLGASAFQVGMLTTLPILIGSAFQWFAAGWSAQTGHRRWVLATATLQAAVLVPILLLGIRPLDGYGWLLFWVCVYWMLALGMNPAWNAWMGRMIPPEVRSRYFGRRNLAVHATLFLSVSAAGFLLHFIEESKHGSGLGFVLLFGIAALMRVASVFYLAQQHDPGDGEAVQRVPLMELLEDFRRKPYGRLIFLMVLTNGAVNVSAAYFTPFMLEKLDLSYARFTILTGTIVVARVLASPYWGEIARSYGNRRALQVAVTLIVPLSSLWVVTDNFAYLVGLQLLAGFAWAGVELAQFLNFFDCTDDRNRAQVLSIFNLLNGIAIVIASTLGGTILRELGEPGYAVIFILSSALRAVSLVYLGRKVGVKRSAGEHSFRNVFVRVLTLRPGQGADNRPVVMPEGR